jgi:plastocyanin
MTTHIIAKTFRLIPRSSEFLNRKTGQRGEIFYDQFANTLRLYDGQTSGGFRLARTDLINIPNEVFLAKAQAAGVDGSANNAFSTISVSGQSNVVADSVSDTLTLVAGSNITITTNSSNDSITISSTTDPIELPPSFGTIEVNGQQSILATESEDTVSIVGGNGISVTTTGKIITISGDGTGIVGDFAFGVAADDSVVRFITSGNTFKIAGSGSISTSSDESGNITIDGLTGVTTFNTLTDSISAGLTVDEIFLPAITALTVSNSGASAYLFDQYTGNNPTIYAISGTTIAFKLTASGHPFLIQDGTGTNYNTGLVHVSTAGVVSTGSAAQGKDSGTLYWKVPATISGGYRYQCSLHAPMAGSIFIKNFSAI